MKNAISESGMVGKNGQLLMPMERVNAFFKANAGKRVVVRFEAVEPGSSAAQLAYYYNYILPEIVRALREQGTRMSEKNADFWLVKQYPGDKSDYKFGLDYEVTYAREMMQSQMSDFLEWLKQFAAENLYVYIEDPRTL